MDHDLTRLRRAAAAEPADPQPAARLDQALLRAGLERELLARYAAKFACSARFEDGAPGPTPLERTCARCARGIVFLPDPS